MNAAMDSLPSPCSIQPAPSRAPGPDVPRLVLVAGALAVAGVLGLTAMAISILAMGLGGPESLLHPSAAPLLAAPGLHLWRTIRLLRGRGWILLVVTSLPALFLVSVTLATVASGGWEAWGEPFALGFCSLVAAALALTPTCRDWVAARRAARTG